MGANPDKDVDARTRWADLGVAVEPLDDRTSLGSEFAAAQVTTGVEIDPDIRVVSREDEAHASGAVAFERRFERAPGARVVRCRECARVRRQRLLRGLWASTLDEPPTDPLVPHTQLGRQALLVERDAGLG